MDLRVIIFAFLVTRSKTGRILNNKEYEGKSAVGIWRKFSHFKERATQKDDLTLDFAVFGCDVWSYCHHLASSLRVKPV